MTITDSDGNPLTLTIGQSSYVDNGDGTTTLTDRDGNTCVVSSEKVDLCSDNNPGEAVHTQSITDLKTGTITDYVISSHLRAETSGLTTSVIDGASPVAPDYLVLGSVTAPAWGCPSLFGKVKIRGQMNADGNPAGAPGEALNFRYRINGGVWSNINPLQSISTSLLGSLGAAGSTLTNQEMIIYGERLDVQIPSGATVEFGVASTQGAFDPGEAVQLQAMFGSIEWVETRCEAK